MPYVARLHSKDSVYGYKKPQIACSAINGDTARICKIVEEIFEIPCESVRNYLSISLTPSNPILHTSRLYALFRDKTAFKSQIKFYASWDDFSSQILIDLDRELEKIAENFGINHTTIRTHYNAHSVESLTAKISSITSLKNIESPLKKCDDVYVIDKDSRYFSEDFPFGLCVLRGFAEIAQVETPTMDKVLQWYQGLFGVEYFDENGVFNGKDLDKSGIPQNFGLRTKSDIMKFYAIQNWGGAVSLFAKKCDYVACEIAVESRRIERAESFAESAEFLKDSSDSTESTKDSIDSIDSIETFGDSNNSIESSDKIDCHSIFLKCFAMTVKDTSAESNKINPHEVRTFSRSASWCIKREKKEAEVPPLFLCKKRKIARLSPKSETAAAVFRSAFASHQPLARLVGERGKCLKNMSAALFAKKCDLINDNIFAEFRRSENIKTAEYLKDSNDSAEYSDKLDCHAKPNGLSRNDEIDLDCHDLTSPSLAMTTNRAIPRKNTASHKFDIDLTSRKVVVGKYAFPIIKEVA